MKSLISLLALTLASSSAAFAQPAQQGAQGPATSIAQRTSGLERRDGYLPFYVDPVRGRVLLEVPKLNEDLLYFVQVAKGIGNVEFKRDLRDGQLKIIESNARFVATHELFVRSGAPCDLLVYCHLTKQSLPDLSNYKQFMRMWHPVQDFCAYRELQARGELSFGGWLRSIMHPQVFPALSLSDPKPAITAVSSQMTGRMHN